MSDRYYDSPEYKALEEAARAWFAKDNPEFLTTGWVILGSGMRVTDLPDDVDESYSLRYLVSAGTNVYTALGLLTAAQGEFLNPTGGDDD